MAGFTTPAELVGGDFFDFITVSDRILGVAIADASGHGLPAALQVRDVYTGLRMGVERDFKIVRTVERLNRIIHQSRMTTRFVSLFYGEIEDDGNLMYVNAGHPHPLHFHGRSVTPLEQTGMVLGPDRQRRPTAAGYRRLEPRRRRPALHRRHGRGARRRRRRVRRRAADRAFLELRDRPCDEIARELVAARPRVTGDARAGGRPDRRRREAALRSRRRTASRGSRRQTSGSLPIVVV